MKLFLNSSGFYDKDNRNKKGFTLIEVLIAFSLMLAISCFTFIKFASFSTLSNTYDTEFMSNSILTFIYSSKQYCREKGRAGYILFDVDRNEISFYDEIHKVNFLEFPDKFTLYNVEKSAAMIHMDSQGVFIRDVNGKDVTSKKVPSKKCTIQFRGRKGGQPCISIPLEFDYE